MSPFTPHTLATTLHDEIPLSLLDLVQQRLATLLGPCYTVVLAGSGDGLEADQYHLAIQHNRSGLSLEDSGRVGPGTIEHLLALGSRTKAMLDSPTFARMANGNPDQLLTWISDLTCSHELQQATAASR